MGSIPTRDERDAFEQYLEGLGLAEVGRLFSTHKWSKGHWEWQFVKGWMLRKGDEGREAYLRADAERVGIEARRTSNSSTARWGVRWQAFAAIALVVIAAMALLTFLRR